MTAPTLTPTGVERTFGQDEIIVSKTDTAGRITYANHLFQEVSGYTEPELLGQPHNMIRHPTCRAACSTCCGARCRAGRRSSPTS